MPSFAFDPVTLPRGIARLREEVRAFVSSEARVVPAERRANSWAVFDADFSRKLAARGWIGMTWPKRYGGGERSALERYVLLEELLAAGAPVGAHWIADRQSGPALLRYGSEKQRDRFLPAITRGECFFCIGMSEPNAGSDLASVRTRGVKTDKGWRINGQKVWTTHAQQAHVMIALVRTADGANDAPKAPAAPAPRGGASALGRPGGGSARHEGLSQFLIDLKTPGITVRPIADLVGDVHFNEVFFDDVLVPDDMLLGVEGQGWQQCTSELSLERSGPERYLSSFALFVELLRVAADGASDALRDAIGRMAAELWTLRQMSLSVAGQLAEGRDPTVEAAVVKDLGNSFEQDLPRRVQALADVDFGTDVSPLAGVLAVLVQTSPSFSLRGGTREILRGIIARGLGLR
jgi:alkylation response protein AidB-like acyl-CoA dehydrogenase